MCKVKKNPVTDSMTQVENKCMDKYLVKDNHITYTGCGRNPGTFCKYQNCPLKDVKTPKRKTI